MKREILVGFVERERNCEVSMQAGGCLHDFLLIHPVRVREFNGDSAEMSNALVTSE